MGAPKLQQMMAQVDGVLTRLEEARLPLADHGFLYGDSVYETMRSFRGKVFGWDAHLARLRRSAAGIYLELPWTDEQLTRELEGFRTRLGPGDHYLRMIVTRGVGELGYTRSESQKPSLILIGGPFVDWEVRPLRATVVARRRNLIDALSPGLKTGNLLNPRLAHMEAAAAGYDEALMLNVQNHLTEATTSNLFLVAGGRLLTPLLDAGLLPGVTRSSLLALATELGIPCAEEHLPASAVMEAEEAFLSSTTRTVAPLECIDARVLTPCPGPVTQRLMDEFRTRYGGL